MQYELVTFFSIYSIIELIAVPFNGYSFINIGYENTESTYFDPTLRVLY